MGLCQPFRLCRQIFGSQNDHVLLVQTMQILVGYLTDHSGRGKVAIGLYDSKLPQTACGDGEAKGRTLQGGLHLFDLIGIGHIKDQRLRIRPLNQETRDIADRGDTAEKGEGTAVLQRPLILQPDVIQAYMGMRGRAVRDYKTVLFLLFALPQGRADPTGCCYIGAGGGGKSQAQQIGVVHTQGSLSAARGNFGDETHRHLGIAIGDAWQGGEGSDGARSRPTEVLTKQLSTRLGQRNQLLLMQQMLIEGGQADGSSLHGWLCGHLCRLRRIR